MSDERCESCKWFDKAYFGANDKGLCRVSAPTKDANGYGTFPVVTFAEWCGEYAARIPAGSLPHVLTFATPLELTQVEREWLLECVKNDMEDAKQRIRLALLDKMRPKEDRERIADKNRVDLGMLETLFAKLKLARASLPLAEVVQE